MVLHLRNRPFSLVRFSFHLFIDAQLKLSLSLAEGHVKPCGCSRWKTSEWNPMGTKGNTYCRVQSCHCVGQGMQIWSETVICDVGFCIRAP